MSTDVKFWSVHYGTPDGEIVKALIWADDVDIFDSKLIFRRGGECVAFVKDVIIAQQVKPNMTNENPLEMPGDLAP